MFWQLWVVTGIFLGFCANVIVKDTGRIAWRLQLGSAFIPSFILAIGIFFCPESPRWLMKHGHIAKGFKSMDKLRAHPIIAARDYYYSYVIYEEELKLAGGSGYFRRLWDCFSVPRIRRSNYGASTVMIAQQVRLLMLNVVLSLTVSDVWYQHHLVLQCFDLHKRRVYHDPSALCFSRLRSYPGRLHNPHPVLDRHQGTQKADIMDFPLHVHFPTGSRSISSQSRRRRLQSRTRGSVYLPLHNRLFARRRSRCM